jgi:general secretion pathway protein G
MWSSRSLIQIVYRIAGSLRSRFIHIPKTLNERIEMGAGDLCFTEKGFTLLELLTVLAIIGTLANVAIPKYIKYKVESQNVIAITEITTIDKEIITYHLENESYPDSLNDLPLNDTTDPWGNPYRYMKVEGAKKGKLRKDQFMVPVNTDYDLYSMGADGKSSSPFTSANSHDDIVRANSGDFIGIASKF